jgi:hypothetical protein
LWPIGVAPLLPDGVQPRLDKKGFIEVNDRYETSVTVRERPVKLFAQHGFSDGLKTVEGCKGDEIRDPVALQGEIPPSDLFGLAMLSNESPLERA